MCFSCQGKRSSKALRVETKAMELEEELRGPESYNPRYCALDADTDSLVQMVETPKMLRRFMHLFKAIGYRALRGSGVGALESPRCGAAVSD